MGQTTAMSFNIRYDNPSDNENNWEHRKAEVVTMIQYYSPEILGIQEGLQHQVTYMDSTLTNYKYVGVGRDDGKYKGEYAAIFYKRERLKLLESETYWLSETPDKVSVGWDAVMERIVTFAKFEDIKTKDTLSVFNAHFDHIGKTSRKKSAELILKIIKDKKILESKVLVMGDLNCKPKEKPIEILKELLEDSYNRRNVVSYGPLGTFNSFDSAKLLNKRIDYIVTKNIKVLTYVHLDDKRKNNLYLSDHLPVLIKIE